MLRVETAKGADDVMAAYAAGTGHEHCSSANLNVAAVYAAVLYKRERATMLLPSLVLRPEASRMQTRSDNLTHTHTHSLTQSHTNTHTPSLSVPAQLQSHRRPD